MINSKRKVSIIFIIITFLVLFSLFILFNNLSVKKYLNMYGNKVLDYLLIDNISISNNTVLGINRKLEEENNELKKILE